jgi:hypothetical protein
MQIIMEPFVMHLKETVKMELKRIRRELPATDSEISSGSSV